MPNDFAFKSNSNASISKENLLGKKLEYMNVHSPLPIIDLVMGMN